MSKTMVQNNEIMIESISIHTYKVFTQAFTTNTRRVDGRGQSFNLPTISRDTPCKTSSAINSPKNNCY